MPNHPKSSPPSQILDNAPCGLLTHGSQGAIIETNIRLKIWLGMSASELDGLRMIHLFSKASRIVYETSIEPLLSLQGHVDGASLDLVAKDGAKVPVLLSAETSGSGDDRTTTIIFLLADARRAFERDLAKARAEAESQLSAAQREGELREQFVAILGHDLLNPLASISSGVRMLSREPLSNKSTEVIRLTQGSVHRMSLLITNILDFARNRLGGGIQLNLSDDAELELEIRQVVEEVRSSQPDREICLDISKHIGINCDVPRIGQLLSNLLGNAITYGDPMRPIYVDLSITDESRFQLSVRNSGAPIPLSSMKRLFDPFVRSTNHSDRKGLGLGLYVASEIAKAHNGRLDVISDDENTTFTFSFPLTEADTASY